MIPCVRHCVHRCCGAFPSVLLSRVRLLLWSQVVWLSGMINPQSFLTAIAQQTAQRTSQELDKLVIQTDVTKRMAGEVDASSRDGAYVSGFYLQGCRWDTSSGGLDRSKPREMFW